MSSIFARCVGLTERSVLRPEAAALVVERRSSLSYAEARVVVFDYFGVKRGKISETMKISVETVRSYWKRIYLKTGLRGRPSIRQWVETILKHELDGETGS